MNNFMKESIIEAKIAMRENTIPIGCVIVFENKIIARAHNGVFWHAEILCIQEAQKTLGSNNLTGCSIFITLKPCPMCLYAIQLSKIERIVYGCDNEKIINFKTELINLDNETCKNLMKEGFKKIREEKLNDI
jgi:tRNA(adenine34) deaminase